MKPKQRLEQGEKVKIEHKKWTEEHAATIQKRTLQSEVSSLRLNSNRRATLLKEIAHIRFDNLVLLWLWGDHLESVEIMPSMYMPHLAYLSLDRNFITSVRVLRKAHWPSLDRLSIFQNYFPDASTITQCFFPEMETLFIFWSVFFTQETNQFTDPSFLCKLSSHSFKGGSLKYQSGISFSDHAKSVINNRLLKRHN